jgi:CelD/BcsL family acetyltransferase involved in cellulose biosynthesis
VSNLRPDVQVLVGAEAVQAAIQPWTTLWHADPRAGAAQHPTVTLGLASVLDLPGEPALVVVTDRVGGGWMAALPLRCTADGWSGLPFRIAGPPAGWHLPTAEPLVAPPTAAAAWPALTAALEGALPWEQLDLRFLPAEGPLAHQLHGTRSAAGEARVLSLANGPQYSGSGAARMRQYTRRLERRGQCVITPAASASEVPEIMTRFAELHTARWADEGAAAEFRDPATRARLVDWAVDAQTAGLLTIGAIRLEGDVIAVHLALNDRSGRTAWRIASSPDFPDVSLGRLLFSRMIEQAHVDGCAWYAFGRGEEAYKQSWVTEAQPLIRLVRSATHPGAHVRRLAARLSRARSDRA